MSYRCVYEKMFSHYGCYCCSGICSCEPDVVEYASDDDETEWEKNAPWAQKGADVKESATG